MDSEGLANDIKRIRIQLYHLLIFATEPFQVSIRIVATPQSEIEPPLND